MDYRFFIIIGIIILLFIILKIRQKRKSRRLTEELLSSWAKDSNIKYKEDDVKRISGYFTNKKDDTSFYIDDITWNDIDMENIFKKMNRTSSFAGENILYYILRSSKFEASILEKRTKIIDLFSRDKDLRVDMQKTLLTLGRERFINVVDYISLKTRGSIWTSIIYRLLALFAMVSISTIAFDLELGIKLLVPSFVVNLLVYKLTMLKINIDLKIINNIANLIRCAKKISKNKNEELEEYTNRLKLLYQKVKVIDNRAMAVSYNTENELSEYIKILLLTEVINYNRISKAIVKYKEEILEMYEIIGQIDALISIASFRDGLDYYSIPCFENNTAKHLNIKDFYHPLIKNPVTNSIDTSKSVLITGSNASGKSTFLKALAINTLFSQTINLSLSTYHKSSYFKILSSMALADDLSSGESYYIVEIKSIKRVIDNISKDISTLCFVDEVLRGTNTIERIAASSKILEYLATNNSICFTASHDIELASILKGNFENYHFRERFEDGNIIFDYKLYDGKSQTRNAIKLLEVIGFDRQIVESAQELAKKYELTGKW